jgi:hypothetical protein
MRLRLIFAAVLLLLLTGALYWSEHRKPADDTAKAAGDVAPAILKLDEASITKLELKKKDAEPIVLTRNGSGTWQIIEPKPFAADQSQVSSAVSTLSSLNADRLVDEKASDVKQYGFARPSLEVDITGKNNKTQTLLIGDDTPTGSDVYAMLAGDPRVFTIANYKKTSFDKGLNDLRDKRLLTVEADKISRLEVDRKDQVVEFGRDKDQWQILKPKPMRADSVQVGELVGKITDARMDLTGSDKDAAEATSAFATAAPIATAKLTDQSGTQELQVRKSKDTYYAKSTVVEGAYKVASDLGQALDKGLDDFRNKKLFDFGFSDPAKIEMHAGAGAYFLMKGGSDWWSNGKKMDAGSVEDFVEKLRDLTADRFVDSGFDHPTIEVIVSSAGAKNAERVSIAKSGTSYIAKRENEATLYELSSSAVDGLQKAATDIKPASASAK